MAKRGREKKREEEEERKEREKGGVLAQIARFGKLFSYFIIYSELCE